MKRGKTRSEVSVVSVKSEIKEDNIYIPPLDDVIVKIYNLRLTDEERPHYAIKVTFFDQLIITNTIKPIGARDKVKKEVILQGAMSYDPSDYERMCVLANTPLVVQIQPLITADASDEISFARNYQNQDSSITTQSQTTVLKSTEVSCSNIDILPLFIEKDAMMVTKRMEPMIEPSVLCRRSWENLPLLTAKIEVKRDPANARHHAILKAANYMKITLVGAYNMLIPFDDESAYTAATKTPLHNENNTGLVTYNYGFRYPHGFNSTNFYPRWEHLRIGDVIFAKSEEKFICEYKDIQNEANIDLHYYLEKMPSNTKIIWGSFHRTLMLLQSEKCLFDHLRQYKWPFEMHIYNDVEGYSFMGFVDLFLLLYPGVRTVRLAVPLRWINGDEMYIECGCDLLLTPNEKMPSAAATSQKYSKGIDDSLPFNNSFEKPPPTGRDGNNAFVILEVRLGRPLKEIVIPPIITPKEINEMLKEMEDQGPNKRECIGRGQMEQEWQKIVISACSSLRRVPYYSAVDLCGFNRQLSETRTRVELTTSFWQSAAIYLNNNFVLQDFLGDTYEEMIMISHTCLMRSAISALVNDGSKKLSPTLRAARHAKQMRDPEHAVDLYLQLVTENSRDANSWRELAVCLRDVDRDWANVCINKSIVLDPRHPLTLLCKGCWIVEEDLNAAEIFFTALLALYPFWTVAWAVANTYYLERQLFHMADQLWLHLKKFIKIGAVLEDFEGIGFIDATIQVLHVYRTLATGLDKEWKDYPRTWEYELGDWWEQTPLLPGVSMYYDATDLLLRTRALIMADTCVSRAFCESGESPVYYHMVALCCRLRGNANDALCHLQDGIKKFGEISYLRSLEAECLHRLKRCNEAFAAAEKSGCSLGAYGILLSLPNRDPDRERSILFDLVRRHPSAYTWMALGENWIKQATREGAAGDAGRSEEQKNAVKCAEACAVRALQYDRSSSRAWALLSKVVKTSSRRSHCFEMAIACGYKQPPEKFIVKTSNNPMCDRVGFALHECRCDKKSNL